MPDPDLNGKDVYNTWHDTSHVRGILRRTSLTDYLTPEPHCQTVLDYDALNKQENAKWVPKGMRCLFPGDQYCLAALSAAGEDAVTLREFDLKAAKFVDGGFTLDRSKQTVVWAERGGVLVSANIRGGGEFGPAWHEAGLKTHRQRIHEDFAAVGEDLIKRRITSPRRLGIEGTSNGGLLVGRGNDSAPEDVERRCHRVPLLDMLRFEQIAAGASWVAEYGSVTVPEQRAFLHPFLLTIGSKPT